MARMNTFASYEEMRASVGGDDRKPPLFCPKPRRLGQLTGSEPFRSIQWQASHQNVLPDFNASADLTDIFLKKGGDVASSPPFFFGSPPSRAANPVVHDARFGEEKPALNPPPLSPSPSPHKGCARAKFGLKPAVRVEGFDCRLDGDRRSITAVA